jgi:peptidyl-prolyl cis-trans isomerase C
MLRRAAPLFFVAAVLLAYLYGRHHSGATPTAIPLKLPSRPGIALATFDRQTITDQDFRAQLDSQNPFNRQRFATAEGRKEFLEILVRNELLAEAASRKGYDRDPRLISEAKRQMATRFVEDEFSEAAIEKRLTDEDARRFYEEHLEDYQRPERIRGAIIFLSAPAGDAALRDRKRATANEILAVIREKEPKDPLAFAAVARVKSEDAESRAIDGDMRFLSKDELAKRWGPQIAAAAGALREVGKVSGVIETRTGFAILKLLNIDPGERRSFEASKETVRARAANDRRTRLFEDYLAGLKRDSGLVIDDKALGSMSIEARASPPHVLALDASGAAIAGGRDR